MDSKTASDFINRLWDAEIVPALETYIRANYTPDVEIVNSHFAGRVWTLKQ